MNALALFSHAEQLARFSPDNEKHSRLKIFLAQIKNCEIFWFDRRDCVESVGSIRIGVYVDGKRVLSVSSRPLMVSTWNPVGLGVDEAHEIFVAFGVTVGNAVRNCQSLFPSLGTQT